VSKKLCGVTPSLDQLVVIEVLETVMIVFIIIANHQEILAGSNQWITYWVSICCQGHEHQGMHGGGRS
jgi:hypothetical protein